MAEEIGVSRQAVAKWESGETMPDMVNCMALAKLYNVSLDDLVNYRREEHGGGCLNGKVCENFYILMHFAPSGLTTFCQACIFFVEMKKSRCFFARKSMNRIAEKENACYNR